MTRGSPWPWLALAVWCLWLGAAEGRLAAAGALGGWVPAAGLVLVLALEPGLGRREARRAALVAALARVAFSADPPLAVVAGFLGAVAVAHALRSVVDTDAAAPRALLAGATALGVLGLAAAARHARLAPELERLGAQAPPFPADAVLRAALATAACALVAAPLFARLPGLSPLRRRPA